MSTFLVYKYWFKNNRVIALVFLLLTCVIYTNTLRGEYVFDDAVVIEKRPELAQVSLFPKLLISPYHQNTPQSGLYRPLTMMSFSLNRIFFGAGTFSFHFVNMLLAGLNAFLVFLLIEMLTKNRRAAFLSGLLFLFHPIHTEAVSSIVGRAELLMLLWGIVALMLWYRKRTILASIAFLLALLSKETALAFIPIFFVIAWRLDGLVFWKAIKKSIFVVPVAIYFGLRFFVLKSYVLGSVVQYVENPLRLSSLAVRVSTAFKVTFLYLQKLLIPRHLSADYSFQAIALLSRPNWQAIFGIGFLVVLIFLLFWKKTPSWCRVATAFFLFPYLLISNIFMTIGTTMAERLMYVPSVGFVIVLGFGLDALARLKKGAVICGIVVAPLLFWYGLATIGRNRDWRSNQTLFESAVKIVPNSVLVHSSLAAIALEDMRWDDARRELAIAQSIYPKYAHTLNLLGVLALHDVDQKKAEEYFKLALTISPYHINAYRNLAQVYYSQKKYDLAGDNLLSVIRLNPNESIIKDFSYIRIETGNPQESIDIVEKYIGKEPSQPEFNFILGIAYFRLRNSAQAVYYLQRAKKAGYDDSMLDVMLKTLGL